MRPSSHLLTYVGVAIAVVGFVLIGFTWARVAGLTSVPLQVPYLVSGGFAGIGAILVGLTLIDIQAKRWDSARRDRQLEQLRELLDQIRVLMGGSDLERSSDGDAAEPASRLTER